MISALPKSEGNLSTALSEALRQDIIHGRAKPGAKLGVMALRDRFGVASTVVREALLRLLPCGLVASEDWRGFRVADMSIEDLLEVTRLRVNLEGQAVRESIAKGDTEWEVGVVSAFHRLARSEGISPEDRRARHRAFHDALVASASPWLLRFHRILYDHTERYRNFCLIHAKDLDLERGRDTQVEHKQIMEYALERDADLAIKVISEHLNTTAGSVVEAHRRIGGFIASNSARALSRRVRTERVKGI